MERILVALSFQACIDESASQEDFVLGGHIATAGNWAILARDWEALLRSHGTLAENGKYHFKMSEMAMTSERMARVPAFYKLIEENVSTSISCRINLPEFKRAQERIHQLAAQVGWAPLNLNYWANPYFFYFPRFG
jgi:hypothetical protein